MYIRLNVMAQKVKALASDDLSFVPITIMVEELTSSIVL